MTRLRLLASLLCARGSGRASQPRARRRQEGDGRGQAERTVSASSSVSSPYGSWTRAASPMPSLSPPPSSSLSSSPSSSSSSSSSLLLLLLLLALLLALPIDGLAIVGLLVVRVLERLLGLALVPVEARRHLRRRRPCRPLHPEDRLGLRLALLLLLRRRYRRRPAALTVPPLEAASGTRPTSASSCSRQAGHSDAHSLSVLRRMWYRGRTAPLQGLVRQLPRELRAAFGARAGLRACCCPRSTPALLTSIVLKIPLRFFGMVSGESNAVRRSIWARRASYL